MPDLPTLLIREGFALTGRAAEQLIRSGRVRVDGRIVTDPAYVLPPSPGGWWLLQVGDVDRGRVWAHEY